MKQFVLREPSAVLTATGPDAFSYLQSQGSQDLRGLKPGGAAYGLWLDRKGRVQGDSHILRLEEERFLLVSHGTPASVLLDRLQQNLVADEVDISDVTAGHLLMTSWGGEPGTLGPGNFVAEANGRVRAWAGRLAGGYSEERIGPVSEMAFLAGLMRAGGGRETGLASLEAERIAAGVAMVPQDAGPGTLPQEAGLDAVAVSYTKGCYLGQEVMARLHSMGTPQRGLRKLRLAAPARHLPAPVVTSEGREIGLMTSQAECQGIWLGLAVLGLRHLPATGTVLIESAEAQVVT